MTSPTGITNAMLYASVRLEINLYYPNSQNAPSAQASGFLYHDDASQRILLITCRHCVDDTYPNPDSRGRRIETVRMWAHQAPIGDMYAVPGEPYYSDLDPSCFLFPADRSLDLAVYPLHGTSRSGGSGGALYYIQTGLLASADDVALRLAVGDHLMFPGFPEWFDKNGLRPVMRTGTIVSDPRSDYRYGDGEPRPGDGIEQIAYEAFSRSGDSGSPVFAVGKISYDENNLAEPVHRSLQMIGVNAGHFESGGQHSGVSRLQKSTALTALMEELFADSGGPP